MECDSRASWDIDIMRLFLLYSESVGRPITKHSFKSLRSSALAVESQILPGGPTINILHCDIPIPNLANELRNGSFIRNTRRHSLLSSLLLVHPVDDQSEVQH